MLFIMGKFIVPLTAEMINLRKAKIDADLAAAAELKQKVEKTLEKYNEALSNASEEANASVLKTKEELNALMERREAELAAEIGRQILAAEKKIEKARQKALSEVDGIAAKLAPIVWKKLDFDKFPSAELQAVVKATGELKK